MQAVKAYSSKFEGVALVSDVKYLTYKAVIKTQQGYQLLGYFASGSAAVKAYNRAAKKVRINDLVVRLKALTI